MQYRESDRGSEVQENLSITEPYNSGSLQELSLTVEEKEKFQTLGPISQKEIEENDWDLFMDELNS